MDPEEHYRALCTKVDAFFERVQERHGDQMQCKSGCFDCCQAGLTVTLVEAASIARYLLGGVEGPEGPFDTRAAHAAQGNRGDSAAHAAQGNRGGATQGNRIGAARGNRGGCVALDEGGRCTIYAVRPLVCRSHGVPIRHREPGRSLPVLDACYRNFTDGALAAVPAEDQLDQNTLSTTLAAIDAAFADAAGTPRGTRLELEELLADPAGLFDVDVEDQP